MKLGLISLGCSKNTVDSENMLGILVKEKNLELVENIEEADIIIVNTCAFINDAKEESIQTILEMSDYKKDGSLKKLIVSGCLSERYKEELLKEIPEIDAVVGTGDVDKIGEVVDSIIDGKKELRVGSLDFLPTSKTPRMLTNYPHSAYLKISEGCDKHCTYCIIPSLRGDLRSRTIEDVVAEAENLAKDGVVELNLLAQEITEYGKDIYGKRMLPELLKELVKVEGIKWIRLYYMYPNSISDELIEVIKNEPKICNYFDVPIQHISDNILQQMGRAKSGEVIRNILGRIRNAIPEATIRTTVIVGFPGETEENFQELKEFIEEFKFDYVGVFKYSREEDTVAYDLPNQIPEEIKEERWAELLNIQGEIIERKNEKFIGETVDVIIDGISTESEYMLEGRMRTQALDIDGKVLTSDGTAKIGDIVKVKIEQNFQYDFIGPILDEE
ncbi:30S ribosomal protein S12 methylthiotransferase RimO [Fusobacterium perfoetens]|uniref:30S ribosomal protein S12 methylthiotransferase RimO n=1 Tax=Fusobacterium perfoetens TaxID=852 RepID=UPI0004806E13|nr:30S ribosomal protein S12 methylthiotransferase RimO [Fusobacterium perfoetens]MCI6152367.1 30S ribosomal protein S12 methylthiotransferase RimO [Fusobacterium perfoetens]MDY3236966.1 30S ribosomal protein S12 methylthiotransferase RimO [Fusobacterium perfoetens]